MQNIDKIKNCIGFAYNTLSNLLGTNTLKVFPIGKTASVLNKQNVLLDDSNFIIKIGLEVDNPDNIFEYLYEAFINFNYEVIKVGKALSIRFSTEELGSFTVILYFTVNQKLLEWVFHYGYQTKFKPLDKEFLINIIAETLPPHVEEWQNKSLSIINRYSITKFSKEYGIYTISKTFKGRHGYAKKAFETGIKIVRYNDPMDIINFLLDVDSIYLQNKNAITTEVILDSVEKSNRMNAKRKRTIKKKFLI
jgi:hypothetical protein